MLCVVHRANSPLDGLGRGDVGRSDQDEGSDTDTERSQKGSSTFERLQRQFLVEPWQRHGVHRLEAHGNLEATLERHGESRPIFLDRLDIAAGHSWITQLAAGVDQATVELLGLAGAVSHSDPESEKVVLFFTDGAPTLPYRGYEADNVREVLHAARRARSAGVRIHSFAIGPEALEGPVSTVEMAAITDGLFTPVRDPGTLVQLVEDVSFAHVQEVEVRNATSGAVAHRVRVHADGSWDALVPLATGKNRLQVVARTDDGAEATREIEVHYAPDAPRPFIPVELVPKHNALLEARLLELQHDREAADRQQAEAARRELVLEMERERAAAVERAARQRKELQLEVETPGAP